MATPLAERLSELPANYSNQARCWIAPDCKPLGRSIGLNSRANRARKIATQKAGATYSLSPPRPTPNKELLKAERAAPARSAINFISALAQSILIGPESKRSYIWKIPASFVMKRFGGSVQDKKPPSNQRLRLEMSCISLRPNRATVARSGHCSCFVRP
jgi:hypothetical protein